MSEDRKKEILDRLTQLQDCFYWFVDNLAEDGPEGVLLRNLCSGDIVDAGVNRCRSIIKNII